MPFTAAEQTLANMREGLWSNGWPSSIRKLRDALLAMAGVSPARQVFCPPIEQIKIAISEKTRFWKESRLHPHESQTFIRKWCVPNYSCSLLRRTAANRRWNPSQGGCEL